MSNLSKIEFNLRSFLEAIEKIESYSKEFEVSFIYCL